LFNKWYVTNINKHKIHQERNSLAQKEQQDTTVRW